jgi:hypothetical protein
MNKEKEGRKKIDWSKFPPNVIKEICEIEKKQLDESKAEWDKLLQKWLNFNVKNLKKYSEKEVLEQLNILMSLPSSTLDKFTDDNGNITMKWFEQFKNK